MKTKEELNALRNEIEALNKKARGAYCGRTVSSYGWCFR